MLLVKTKIAPSPINGIGLFADQFIQKGTIIWKFQPGFDLKINTAELNVLSEPAKQQFLKYAYLNKHTSKYVLCFDDERFINHSDQPNILEGPLQDGEECFDVAGRDHSTGRGTNL